MSRKKYTLLMNRPALLVLFTVLAVSAIPVSLANAKDHPAPAAESESGSVVCAPVAYFSPPDDCLPLGPAESLSEAALLGMDDPSQGVPGYAPDPALNYVPFNYFKVQESGTSLYPSLDSAMSGSGAAATVNPGFVYLSYTDRVETNKGVFYTLDGGMWIPGDGSRVSTPVFQGLVLSATPRHAFGWVLQEANAYKYPNYMPSNPVARKLYRYNFVQIYSVQNVEGSEWYLIGLDEWVEGRNVAGVFPTTRPPEGVINGRWIDVNLAEQTLTVYDDNRMVYATLISSGVEPFWTRPGLFQIYKELDADYMTGSFEADKSDYYYLQNVPWIMYFDKARALHGSYWHTLFGYPQSHGCVNLSIGDAHWLFDWASEGDWVWVHDPSGLTPTDPAIYGDGGA
jgi:hypothetical protein